MTALWGRKALDNIIDLDLTFSVDRERDRQTVSLRQWPAFNLPKAQKAFNEVYRTLNANKRLSS